MKVLSKTKIKLISRLQQKKWRDELGCFLAEGTKLVIDLSTSFKCILLVVTPDWLKDHLPIQTEEILIVTSEEFKKISTQKTPQGVLAIFKKKETKWLFPEISSQLCFALEDIQDPGNLGTIIRVADWFGISNIFCSQYSADVYGTKVVQATMGALARVQVHIVHLPDFLIESKKYQIPLYGTFLKGENIYTTSLTTEGIIVLGNEGNGISSALENIIPTHLTIPPYPSENFTSESLNVSVAAGIVAAEFRRRLVINKEI